MAGFAWLFAPNTPYRHLSRVWPISGDKKFGGHQVKPPYFDAAAELARVGRYLESELLTAQSRAVAGRAAGGVGGHWSEGTGRERVLEVVGRLRPSGGDAEREAIGAAAAVSATS